MLNAIVRPPIVTVLGHVDHGKTSLLDAIRKTKVATREAGGITQGIGASVVASSEGQEITFIDTPGHAAFFGMRGRGAAACDIAVLVVAADDGVKPQTKESISIIKDSGVPYVVAITKTDLATSNIESVKGQLEKEGLILEGRGGDTPVALVSAKTGTGLTELLTTISLLWEVNQSSGPVDSSLKAVVVETTKDRRGLLCLVVVKQGTINVGDTVYSGNVSTRVRGIFDDNSKSVKTLIAGYPGQILGFETLPEVGSVITNTKDETAVSENQSLFSKRTREDKDKPTLLIKAQHAGSLEALLAAIPTEYSVISASVGDITESDILAAKSSNALVFAFESKIGSSVKKLADTESVRVYQFDIIYKLIEKLDEITKSGLTVILGKSEIIATFPFDNKRVAGCRVKEGRVAKGDKINIIRGEKLVGESKIVTMKKSKADVTSAIPSEEVGVIMSPQLDFAVGDVLLSVAK